MRYSWYFTMLLTTVNTLQMTRESRVVVEGKREYKVRRLLIMSFRHSLEVPVTVMWGVTWTLKTELPFDVGRHVLIQVVTCGLWTRTSHWCGTSCVYTSCDVWTLKQNFPLMWNITCLYKSRHMDFETELPRLSWILVISAAWSFNAFLPITTPP